MTPAAHRHFQSTSTPKDKRVAWLADQHYDVVMPMWLRIQSNLRATSTDRRVIYLYDRHARDAEAASTWRSTRWWRMTPYARLSLLGMSAIAAPVGYFLRKWSP